MLVLWDIDATLITTSRAGIAAMGRAGRRLFGDGFNEHTVEYAGRLDPLIITDLLDRHAQPSGEVEIQRFREAYRESLEGLLAERNTAVQCPGVAGVLDALEGVGEFCAMGLLTGNFPETGAIKLRAAGIDPGRFPIQVWGCDSPHRPPSRDHLPAVGLERYRARYGRPIAPEEATVIGDTPHDIRCARAHGCRSLGVATGMFSAQELSASGADLALADLTDTERVVSWLMKTGAMAR